MHVSRSVMSLFVVSLLGLPVDSVVPASPSSGDRQPTSLAIVAGSIYNTVAAYGEAARTVDCYVCIEWNVPKGEIIGHGPLHCTVDAGCPYHRFPVGIENGGDWCNSIGGMSPDEEIEDDGTPDEFSAVVNCVAIGPLPGNLHGNPKTKVCTGHPDCGFDECWPECSSPSASAELTLFVEAKKWTEVRRFVEKYRQAPNVVINTERQAIQILNCDGLVGIHLPVPSAVLQ